MASRLPKSQQRFQHVHSCLGNSLFGDQSQQRIAIVISQFVVESLLVVAHLAENGLLELFRQLAGNAGFGSSQN